MPTRRQVVIINDHGYVSGGAAVVALEQALALKRAGHDVTWVCFSKEIDQRLVDADIKVINWPVAELSAPRAVIPNLFNGIFNILVFFRLFHLFKKLEEHSTIFHLHTWTKRISPSIFLVFSLLRSRLFVTLHDYFIACPNGAFFNFVQNEKCKLQPLSSSCLRSNCDRRSYAQKLWRCARQLVQQALIHLIRRKITMIAVSRFSREILRQHVPDDIQIFTLENHVQRTSDTRVKAEKNQRFFYVGKTSQEKGVPLLCEAFTRLRLPLTLIGSSSDLDVLRRTFDAENISFLSWLTKEEIVEHLTSARALVFPSKWYETYGLVVAEAKLMGVPPIVAKGSAAVDLVTDGVDGLHFEEGNIDHLMSQIQIVAESDGLVKSMSRRAYAAGIDTQKIRIEDRLFAIVDAANAGLSCEV